MSVQHEGPVNHYDKPIQVLIGDAVDVLVPSRDGVQGTTQNTLLGALRDISAAGYSGSLVVHEPDGSADYTLAATKADFNGASAENSWLAEIPSSVTTGWVESDVVGEMIETDATGSPSKPRVIAELKFVIRKRPSARA